MTNWGNHKSDTMAKVQHFSGISKRIPFEGFDFYDLFRVTFENSELGRMKRLLPLHKMAVNFGLVSNHPLRKRGRKSFFSPEGKVAMMFLLRHPHSERSPLGGASGRAERDQCGIRDI